MKNTLKTLVLVGSCLLSANVMADESAKEVKFAGDVKFASFCKAVVLDDVSILRSSITRQVGHVAGNQRDVLRRVVEADGLKCNGESLVDFSKSRNASNIYAYLTAKR